MRYKGRSLFLSVYSRKALMQGNKLLFSQLPKSSHSSVVRLKTCNCESSVHKVRLQETSRGIRV